MYDKPELSTFFHTCFKHDFVFRSFDDSAVFVQGRHYAELWTRNNELSYHE